VDDAADLVFDLLEGAEDVGVVLGEVAHPEEAVQHAAHLVAVDLAELGHSQRRDQVEYAYPPCNSFVSDLATPRPGSVSHSARMSRRGAEREETSRRKT